MSSQNETLAKETKNETSIFKIAINEYITQINSLVDTMPIVLKILVSNTKIHFEKLDEFIKQKSTKIDEDSYSLPIELHSHHELLISNVEKSAEAIRLWPCNMVVSFVSIYDAFLGNIIKAMYKTSPEQLKECNREFSVKDILQFGSIEEAKERVIEKEAETVIRNSHSEQLDWFTKKINCPFKNFASYNQFIEITERRNLFVHTNGVVSRQYLKICTENNVNDISKIKVGDTLFVTHEYLQNCYKILFEVGVKLGIVVWRKLKKNDKDADYYLNEVCYDLLKQGRYDLAKTMLHFATETIKNPVTEEVRRMFIINKALAYYLSGDKDTCKTIINKEDWSASAIMFQLAIAVLKEDYELAVSKMENAKSDINNIEYYEWPLFKNFRERSEFKSKYQEIYGKEFKYTEPKKDNSKEILQYAMNIQTKAEKSRKNTKGKIQPEENIAKE